MSRHGTLAYPVVTGRGQLVDRLFLKLGWMPGYCPVCGHWSVMAPILDNMRESGRCRRCMSTNRQRQLATVLSCILSQQIGRRVYSLRAASKLGGISIYNTESTGAIHNELKRLPTYTFSEYFGPEVKHGANVEGVQHQDLMRLTFDAESFDVVISSDVFEHVPEPYTAHCEIYRILKPGGRHVFTVPFYQTEFLDEQRARLDANAQVVFLKEPMYHEDPLRTEGALVYTIFSLEMLVRLKKIGFATNMYHLHDATRGILGPNALVFDAVKT